MHYPCKIAEKTGHFDWPCLARRPPCVWQRPSRASRASRPSRPSWPSRPSRPWRIKASDKHPDHPGQAPMLIRPIRFWFLMLILHADVAKENLIWQIPLKYQFSEIPAQLRSQLLRRNLCWSYLSRFHCNRSCWYWKVSHESLMEKVYIHICGFASRPCFPAQDVHPPINWFWRYPIPTRRSLFSDRKVQGFTVTLQQVRSADLCASACVPQIHSHHLSRFANFQEHPGTTISDAFQETCSVA